MHLEGNRQPKSDDYVHSSQKTVFGLPNTTLEINVLGILLCTRAVSLVYWSNPHGVRQAKLVGKSCFTVRYII